MESDVTKYPEISSLGIEATSTASENYHYVNDNVLPDFAGEGPSSQAPPLPPVTILITTTVPTVTTQTTQLVPERRKRVRRSPNLATMQRQMHLDMLLDESKNTSSGNVVEHSMPNLRQSVRTSSRNRQKVMNFEETESESSCKGDSNGGADTNNLPLANLKVKNSAKRSETKTPTTTKRRRTKKMSKAEQIEQTKDFLDVKRPSSVLADTNLRALLTKASFQRLKPSSQKALINLLPSVDRPKIDPNASNESLRLNTSSLNNEFFNRACIEWRERLAYGEFTNENQTKLKAEAEKEKCKIDPWKQKNFEYIWGEKIQSLAPSNTDSSKKFKMNDTLLPILQKSASEIKSLSGQQENFEIPKSFKESRCKIEPRVSPKRVRTGAITRSSSSYMKMEAMKTPEKIVIYPPSSLEFPRTVVSPAIKNEFNVSVKSEPEPQVQMKLESDSVVKLESDSVLKMSSNVNFGSETTESDTKLDAEPKTEVDRGQKLQIETELDLENKYEPQSPRKMLSELPQNSLDNIPRDEMVPSPILERIQMEEEEEEEPEIVLENPSEYESTYEISNQCRVEESEVDDDEEDMQPLNLQVIREVVPYRNDTEEVSTEGIVEFEEKTPEHIEENDRSPQVLTEAYHEYEAHEMQDILKYEEHESIQEHDHDGQEEEDELENEVQESPMDNCSISDNMDADETDDSSKVYNDAMLNEHDYLKNDILMDSDENQMTPPEQAIEARASLNHIKDNFDNLLQSNQNSVKVNFFSTDDVDSVTATTDTGVLIDDTIDNQDDRAYIDSNCLVKKCVDYSEVIVYSKYNSDNMAVSTANTTTNTIVAKPKTSVIIDNIYEHQDVNSRTIDSVEYSPPQALASEVVETSVVSPVQRIKYNIINSENIILNSYGGNTSRATTQVANTCQSKAKVHDPPESEPIIIETNDCSGIICNTPSNSELIDSGLQRLSYNSLIVHEDQDQYINCNESYLLEESNDETYCHGELHLINNYLKRIHIFNTWYFR